MNYFFYALLAIIGYIIGSLSPAVFLSKKFAGYDIREKGSKNAGSSNVFRIMGAKWGIINFALDFLKGFLPALAGYHLFGLGYYGLIAAGFGVVLGHAFPVFSHFRGGKCVASSTGIVMVLNPVMTLIAFAAGLIIVFITKYVSLASITIFTVYPIISIFMPYPNAVKIFLGFLGVLILILHRENVERLINKKENPIIKPKS